MRVSDIIIRPVLTEKTTKLAQEKVYAFFVHTAANKHQVAEVIKKLYNVEVESVRMMIKKGKEKRVGRKQMTKILPDMKVALVKVTKGVIDLFPQS